MEPFYRIVHFWALSVLIINAGANAQEPMMRRTNGIQGGIVQALLVTPDNIIWAGSSDGGIMRSLDNGISWNQVSTGLPFLSDIYCMAYDKEANVYTGTAQGVFKLQENKWTAINNGLPQGGAHALWCSGNDTLIAATPSGIFRSGNKGALWIPANLQAQILSFASLNSNLIYAAGESIYVSNDNGRSWVNIGNDSIIGANSLCIDSAGYIFIGTYSDGLFRSSDSGKTWHELDAGLHGTFNGFPRTFTISTLHVGPHNEIIFTSNKSLETIFKSTDEGNSWILTRGYGLQFQGFVCMTTDNLKHLLVGGNDFVIARTSDLGANWTKLNPIQIAQGNNVESIAFDSVGNILVGTDNGCVFRSQDQGVNWTWSQPTPQFYSPIRAILVSPWGTIYTGGDASCLSMDGGNTFSLMDGVTLVRCFASDRTGSIFAGSYYSYYCSKDSGKTWNNFGFPNNFSCSATDSLGRFIAGTYDNGVFLSDNQGRTWSRFGFRDTMIQSVIVSDSKIWVATYANGIYSYDGPQSGWVYRGLNGHTLFSIEVFNNKIYACGEGGGYYASTDGGVLWNYTYPLSNDWNTGIFLRLKKSPDGYLWGGTQNAVVYRSNLQVISSVVSQEPAIIPHTITLGQNYPNPFNPSTTISFSLPSKLHVSLKIFDVMGREVSTIVSDVLAAGNYQHQWNASGLPSGVYFYRLQAGAYTETKCLILLR